VADNLKKNAIHEIGYICVPKMIQIS